MSNPVPLRNESDDDEPVKELACLVPDCLTLSFSMFLIGHFSWLDSTIQ